MVDIYNRLRDVDFKGLAPPQNWTTLAADEIQRLRTQLTEAKAEVERAHAAIKLYRDGVDSIYNHSKGGRMLVIKFFGTLHPVIRPTHPNKPERT